MIKKMIISLLILMIVAVFVFSTTSFANADNFKTTPFENGNGAKGGEAVTGILGSILDIVRVAAIGIGLIMITVLAMKYMMAAPEARAEIKGSAIRYILGAVIMFGSAGILTIVEQFASTNIGKGDA